MESKAVIRGSYVSLGRAIAKQTPDTSMKVPGVGRSWLGK